MASLRRQRRVGLIARGNDGLRKIASNTFGKSDSFRLERRTEGEESRLRLFDREEAVHSARQSPARPPLFSSRRMSPTTIARSRGRKSVVSGKGVSVGVDHGGGGTLKKKKNQP